MQLDFQMNSIKIVINVQYPTWYLLLQYNFWYVWISVHCHLLAINYDYLGLVLANYNSSSPIFYLWDNVKRNKQIMHCYCLETLCTLQHINFAMKRQYSMFCSDYHVHPSHTVKKVDFSWNLIFWQLWVQNQFWKNPDPLKSMGELPFLLEKQRFYPFCSLCWHFGWHLC